MSTEIQSGVGSVLEKLGLEPKGGQVVDGRPVLGGPEKYEVTETTVQKVQSLVGKSFVVNGDGSTSL